MKKQLFLFIALFTAVVTTAVIQPTSAQEKPERGQRGQRGGGFGRGDFNMEEFRKRMEDRMRERYGFSEAEWKVIGPRFTAVQELRIRGTFGGFGGRGGRGGRDRDSDSPAAQLRAAIEDDASAKELKDKLTAYRKDRDEKAAKLKKAQADLQVLLTPKQEAQAVLDGLLN